MTEVSLQCCGPSAWDKFKDKKKQKKKQQDCGMTGSTGRVSRFKLNDAEEKKDDLLNSLFDIGQKLLKLSILGQKMAMFWSNLSHLKISPTWFCQRRLQQFPYQI